MKSLSELLKTHRIPGVKEAEVRRACAEALTRVLGVPITSKQVRYTDGAISLAVPPVMKSALVIKFEEAKTLLEREGITLREIR
ncbi:MAG TPA: hypothetical protein VEA92_00480 [Candidatus Paceibacterota bacterium]|nr:hypothetical protein [Candidatus Paceibacterota bacterium]